MSGAGYSATPLAAKLGVKEGFRVALVGAPRGARSLLDPLPAGARVGHDPGTAEVTVVFVRERHRLVAELAELAPAVFPDRPLWVAWPKRASGVPTDITEDVVRELALPLGLVDNKVCAIDETWSGLRLVWRKELRTGAAAGRRGRSRS